LNKNHTMKTKTFFVLSVLSAATPFAAAGGKSGKDHKSGKYSKHSSTSSSSTSSSSTSSSSTSSKSGKGSKSKSSKGYNSRKSNGRQNGHGSHHNHGYERHQLRAKMNERYPDYTGDIQPSGRISVTFPSVDMLKLTYNIHGLEVDCTNCGVHIHTGTTCDVADEVGGHYYSIDVDPWTTDGGAIYNATGYGAAKGSFSVSTGYDTYNENLGHAVVIHGQNGTRLSCGILETRRMFM